VCSVGSTRCGAYRKDGEDCAYLTLGEIMWLMSETVVDLPHCTGKTCPSAWSRKGRKGREEKARSRGRRR